MDNKHFLAMRKALRSQAKRYPNCTIANCDYNSKEYECFVP
ncbi:unnamed protein product [marine sediment metagenome]|uniref:Uncharacterized protein n=1 Tax=marine sediment metagenome TaxID=412755 RepID=X1A117_9ZZZZ